MKENVINNLKVLDISFYPLMGFCFCFPYSIPLTNLFLILSTLIVFITNKNLNPLRDLIKYPIFIAFFILNILYAFAEGFSFKNILNIEQYALLLVMPIAFYNVISKNQFQLFIKVFFVAILSSLIPAVLMSLGNYLDSYDYTEFLYKKLASNIGFHVIEYSLFIALGGLYFLYEYFNNARKIYLMLSIVSFSCDYSAFCKEYNCYIYAYLYYFFNYLPSKKR